MSAYIRGQSQICIVSDATGFPAWQPCIDLSITKTVDGSPLTLTLDRLHAGIPGSLIYGGHELLVPQPADNGRNAGFSDSVLYTGDSSDWNLMTPTWAGCQDDAAQKTSTCESNNLLRGKNAAGDGFECLIQAVNWLKNGQDDGTFSGHGGGRNKRDLTGMLSYLKFQIGLGGDDHIIQCHRSVLVPTLAEIQAGATFNPIPAYYYAPSPSGTDMSVMEWVNTSTGATRAATSLQTSTTEVVMSSNVAGTFAIACVFGPGAAPITAIAFSSAAASGFTSGSVRHLGLATTPGVWFEPTAYCVGARANVITAIVSAAAGLPACTFTAGKTSLP